MTPSLAAGTRFGVYEILGPIGEGGMGVVYHARDSRLERRVAIKLLPPGMAADPQAQQRLRFEAMAAAALDHPYICKIFEIGEHDGAVFLVMEFIVGETLGARMRKGLMPRAETLQIAGEIAEALQAAHAGGILHRDLKPANIMLTQQGHVKIMDFGLAKRMEDIPQSSGDDATVAIAAAQLTMPGTILGTPDYMSPEQVKGLPLNARSDLFSFGVILAEMASGLHPFHKPSDVETLTAVLRDPPTLSGQVDPGLAALVQRLVAKSPDDRYGSAAEVRTQLNNLAVYSGPVTVDKISAERRINWKYPAAVALLAIFGLAIFLSMHFGWPRRASVPAEATAPQTIRSIAVLPLDNFSGDPSQDYFAEGMTDELTSDLATISQLRVISRDSAMQFQGAHRPPTPEIAKALNVDAILEGSVRRAGDRVRITAELIDAKADKNLWSKSFERNSRDVLALQDELAKAIASEINVQLTPGEQSRLASAPTVNPEAHDAYLKGRYFFNRPTDENLKKSIALFEEALRLNPNFAPAYSGLSDAYLWAGFNEDVISAADAKPKAKAAAEKAVQLDDSSAEAHTSLAVYQFFYDFEWPAAEAEFRRALALNPNYAFAHDQFGLLLAFQGRLQEAEAEGKRAAQLDPLSPQIAVDNLFGLVYQGKYQAARDEVKRATDLDPSFFFPHWCSGWIDIQQGRVADAIPELEKSIPDSPSFTTAWLGYAYGASGDRTRAMAELANLKKISLHGKIPPFNLALIYLGLGDRNRAIDYLEEAYASDSQWLTWLRQDRIFVPLHSEPRYIELLKKLRFTKPA